MLLIPKRVQKIKDAGRAEVRALQRARFAEAFRRFGFDRDGVRSLPDTQEVRDFLDGKDPEQT